MAALRRFVEEGPGGTRSDPRGAAHAGGGEISRNAGLELFVDVFNRVAQLYSPDGQRLYRPIGQRAGAAHAKIAEALIAGDAGLARSRMRKHLEGEAGFFRRRRSTRQLLPDSVVWPNGPRARAPRAVARHISQTVVTKNLQPGDLVGTEPELMEREGVSRALLREAVRLLETITSHACAGARGRIVRDGPERRRRDRDGSHLPGPPRDDVGPVGRVPDRRRGGDHGPGGPTHR